MPPPALEAGHESSGSPHGAPVPILALDVPTLEAATALVQRVPSATFFKVGLQLYTAAGPEIVRQLKDAGHRVFLDLKFHDIPNTVAGAIRSAAALEVDLLTIHASGGILMMEAAAEAVAGKPGRPLIFAVSVLTSLTGDGLAIAWGRDDTVPAHEASRLAALALECGVDGIVASVPDLESIRKGTGSRLLTLTPGIRLAGDSAGDQARIATPADAAAAGVDYVVIGRTVTAAPDPAVAFARVTRELTASANA